MLASCACNAKRRCGMLATSEAGEQASGSSLGKSSTAAARGVSASCTAELVSPRCTAVVSERNKDRTAAPSPWRFSSSYTSMIAPTLLRSRSSSVTGVAFTSVAERASSANATVLEQDHQPSGLCAKTSLKKRARCSQRVRPFSTPGDRSVTCAEESASVSSVKHKSTVAGRARSRSAFC